MAINENPQAIKFSNESTRPISDALVGAYYSSLQIISAYNSEGMYDNMQPGTDELGDGSHVDGRAITLGNDHISTVTTLESFRDWMNAEPGRLGLLEKLAVNPRFIRR